MKEDIQKVSALLSALSVTDAGLSQNGNTRLGFYWGAISNRAVLLKLNNSENCTDCDTAGY
jgi:hypothetical protein